MCPHSESEYFQTLETFCQRKILDKDVEFPGLSQVSV